MVTAERRRLLQAQYHFHCRRATCASAGRRKLLLACVATAVMSRVLARPIGPAWAFVVTTRANLSDTASLCCSWGRWMADRTGALAAYGGNRIMARGLRTFCRCEACETPSAAEAESIGLACLSCGGAVVPDCACQPGIVSMSELRAGTGDRVCVRHAVITSCTPCMQRRLIIQESIACSPQNQMCNMAQKFTVVIPEFRRIALDAGARHDFRWRAWMSQWPSLSMQPCCRTTQSWARPTRRTRAALPWTESPLA